MERPVGFPEASAVAEGVFCGALFDAFDEALVRRLGITHAVVLASLPGAWDARKNRYVTLSPPAIRTPLHLSRRSRTPPRTPLHRRTHAHSLPTAGVPLRLNCATASTEHLRFVRRHDRAPHARHRARLLRRRRQRHRHLRLPRFPLRKLPGACARARERAGRTPRGVAWCVCARCACV